ncbi:MAG: tetratricopeptide repeat protein [bacterium]|nr:tetratricopeptide repeat protein [bacterium]
MPRLATILLVFFVSVTTFAAERVPDTELDELQALLDEGDYEAADALFRELEASYPEDAHLRSNYGVFLFAQGDNEGAIRELEEAVSIDKSYHVAYNNLGYVLLMSGRPEEAFEPIKTAALLDPNDNSVLNNLSGCVVYQSDLGKGIELYEELIGKSPDNPRLYNDLGALYLVQSEYDIARGYFERALEVAPDYAGATVNLARVEMAGGDFDAAEALLLPLVEAGGAPGTTLWDAVIALYLNSGDIEKAIEYGEMAVELEPNVENYNNLATVYYLVGKYNKAISCADEGLAIEENAYGLNIRGHSIYQAGLKTEEAEKSLRRSLELDPYDFTTHKNLGDVLFYDGRDAEALSAYQKAVELNPNYYDAWNGIGYCSLRLERYDGAKAAFQRVIDELSASDAPALNGMGATLAYEGDYEGAIEYLEMAVKADPEYSDAHNTLGYVYAETGDFDKALHHQEEANKYSKDDPIQLMNLAIAAYRSGQPEKALSAFDRIILLLGGFDDEGSRAFLAEAYGGRALVRAENGDIEGTKADLNEENKLFAESEPNIVSSYVEALIAKSGGDETAYKEKLAEVVEEVERIEAENPDEKLGFMLEAVYKKAKEELK